MALNVYDSQKGLDYVSNKNKQYLVFSFKHNGFWCADFLGTTSKIDEAGLFPKKVAVEHVKEANASVPGKDMDEMAVPQDLFEDPDYRPRIV